MGKWDRREGLRRVRESWGGRKGGNEEEGGKGEGDGGEWYVINLGIRASGDSGGLGRLG